MALINNNKMEKSRSLTGKCKYINKDSESITCKANRIKKQK